MAKELRLSPRTFIAGATVCGAVAMLMYFGLAVSQRWTPAASINLLAVLIQEQLLLAIPGFSLMFVYFSIRKKSRPALAMALAAITSGALLNLPPLILEPLAFWVNQHLRGAAAWSASVATAALTATWLVSVVSLPVIIGFYRKSKRVGKIAVNCAIAVTICPFWLVAMNQAILEESSECETAV